MGRAERERLRGLIGALQGDAVGYGVTGRADLLRRVDEHRAALEAGIERLERERDAARQQVREMGEHSDTCTYHMLGRQVCRGCRCGRAQDSTAAQEGAGDASR